MRVRGDPASPFALVRDWRLVIANDSIGQASRLRFVDGTTWRPTPETLLQRELTDDEISRAEVLMADRLGTGAIAAD